MDKTLKLVPGNSLLFIMILAISIQIPKLLVGNTDLSNDAPAPQNLPVKLDFEYPDQVDAGTSFIFTIKLQKEGSYNTPGEIHCRFSGGMMPVESNINSAEFSMNDQQANISWKALGSSNIFRFPVKVSTGKSQGGVYPLKVRYIDNTGLELNRNVGIFIYNAGEAPAPPIIGPDAENPFRVNLVYPDEVFFDETYRMDIIITKGKNTGGAKVYVQFPPASQVTVPDYHEHYYKPEQGNLCIRLNSMPASPDFTITCNVTNTSTVRSVYPVRATVEFTNNTSVFYDDFIMVTDQKTATRGFSQRNGSIRAINAAVNADSISLFDELDKLLETWRKSTGRFKTVQPSDDKGSDQKMNSSQAEDILNREIVFYSIQIVASEVVMANIESELRSKGIEERILEDYDGDIYRYTVGDFETLQQAEKMKEKLITKGYPDAFIVEYVNGKRERSFY